MYADIYGDQCDRHRRNDARELVWEICAALLLFAMLLAMSAEALAGEDDHEDATVRLADVRQGSLLWKTRTPGVYHQALRLETDVDMRVSGMIARATVSQRFRNDSGEWAEGVYVFPLPENAAVDHMRMRIGERVIEGVIQERATAKRNYEQARRAGKKAALIEQERPNLFTNSVANIAPGDAVVVEIEYQQTLRYDAGVFRLRFPMAITPRYIPGDTLQTPDGMAQATGSGWAFDTAQVPDASRITPPVLIGEGPANSVTLRVELDVGFPLADLQSAHHHITTRMHGAGRVTVALEHERVAADRDFELMWAPQQGHAPRAALFSEPLGDATYHLVMVLPPAQGVAGGQPLAREVIYIIDTSGSMHGPSLAQARRALVLALQRLRPRDSFNVIAFNSATDLLFESARPATAKNLQLARRYVEGLSAGGGTNMEPALEAALDGGSGLERIRQVLFLTDGAVGNEAQLFGMIEKRLGDSRLFTVGIGAAPNSHFMRRAAQFGRGTFTYIGDVNEVQDKMRALFAKLESPVLANVQVYAPDGITLDYWPRRIPDLYLGEPLLIAARARGGSGVLQISGARGGQPWSARLSLDGGHGGAGIGALWARAKIAALMDSKYEGADEAVVRAGVVAVALRHHLVSKYTSLVAIDKTLARPQHAKLKRHAVPGDLPRGASYQKIFGALPQTATVAEQHLLRGALLLLLALVALLVARTRAQT
ncbi:MAG: marine proteobacterial sortase target protein [Pseudomonadota bacterium]|nr:MAG: marine proteobacterial sortase target protein [Pseudomonadota bacterium]